MNPQKLYAIDTGLLQAMSFRNADDRGAMLENMVFMHLRRQGIHPEYYLTPSGREVDFVIAGKARGLHLVQACWSLEDSQTRLRELRAIHEAKAQLKADSGTIVTWQDEGETEGVRIVPAWRWLLETTNQEGR